MRGYEYKVLVGSPTGTLLMPWASQKVRDEIGRGSFEKKLNAFADEGWELVSANTNSVGGFLYLGTQATVFLRREKAEVIPDSGRD
jgi:hypothetical protein